jgi:hypothetical protein
MSLEVFIGGVLRIFVTVHKPGETFPPGTVDAPGNLSN